MKTLALVLAVSVSSYVHAFIPRSSPGILQPRLEARLCDSNNLAHRTIVRTQRPIMMASQTAIPTWEQIQNLIDLEPSPAESPVLTLYRDNNGWCPFCERVWVALLYKVRSTKRSDIFRLGFESDGLVFKCFRVRTCTCVRSYIHMYKHFEYLRT
jgi:hypothetical protein